MIALTTSTLLAIAGAAILAAALFLPRTVVSPPLAIAPKPPPVERWSPPPAAERERSEASPGWPAMVDPQALGANVAVRRAIAEALLQLDTPWAHAIVRRAQADERDETVLAVLASGRTDPSAHPTPAYAAES